MTTGLRLKKWHSRRLALLGSEDDLNYEGIRWKAQGCNGFLDSLIKNLVRKRDER